MLACMVTIIHPSLHPQLSSEVSDSHIQAAKDLDYEIRLLMLTSGMTREVAVRTLLAQTNRDKLKKLCGETATLNDDDDDKDGRSVSAASVAVESKRILSATQKSPLVSNEPIVHDHVRHPLSNRVADNSSGSTTRVNTVGVSSSSSIISPRDVDSMRVVHTKTATSSSLLRSGSSSIIDLSIIDPDELLVQRVLDDQERRYGVNMHGLITTNNPEVKRVMARRGCSKMEAMVEVFEKSAPATLGLSNTQVRSMGPSQQQQQQRPISTTAQPGSPAGRGGVFLNNNDVDRRRPVGPSSPADRPSYNSYSSYPPQHRQRPTGGGGGGGRPFNEAHIRELTSMGFSRQQAETALSTCRYDVHAAVEYLLQRAT